MDLIFFGGLVIFVIGLIMSHVVVAITRGAARKRETMKKSHRILMWSSVACVALGFVMAALGYILTNSAASPS